MLQKVWLKSPPKQEISTLSNMHKRAVSLSCKSNVNTSEGRKSKLLPLVKYQQGQKLDNFSTIDTEDVNGLQYICISTIMNILKNI